MVAGVCHGQNCRTVFQAPPLRFRRAQGAQRLACWALLYITVQCWDLPTHHGGVLQTWKQLTKSNCSCQKGQPAPSLGTAILSFGSSAGNSGEATWKKFKPGPADQYLPRLQPGEGRKVSCQLVRSWREQLPIWTPEQPRPCGKTLTGWKAVCIAALPGMTGPGSSPREISSVQSSRYCNNNSGLECYLTCSSASPIIWPGKWQTPVLRRRLTPAFLLFLSSNP